MIHASVIVAFLIVYMRGAVEAPLAGPMGWGAVLAWTLAPLLGAGALYSAVIWRCARRIDRFGDHRAVRRAERATRTFNISAILIHAIAVLGVGWLDLVRDWMGDVVLVDELVALAPPVLALMYGYFAMYPIDRRLREAALLASIEQGAPVHPFPSRVRFVLLATRQHVLFMLVPLGAILAWGESTERLAPLVGLNPEGAVASGVQMVGALGVLAVMPPVLCRLWDTVPLAPGPIRDEVMEICKAHGVRVRELLLWRTGGVMINGAVIGLLPGLRYVVLTDGLLEALEPEQVQAVAAHEVGHVKRRHMFWLACSVLGVVMLLGTPLGWGANAIPAGLVERVPYGDEWIVALLLVFTLLGVLGAMGVVSRRFEWQADAFAVQHLSGMRRGDASMRVTPEAAAAMSGALARVARLNAIDPDRFTWRHGSIRTRQRRLRALVGRPVNALRVDRMARWVKLGALVSVIVGGALVVVDFAFFA
ncbi:MAG: M48 family metallopeptidase [Phycisphaerales bacterium JB059]